MNVDWGGLSERGFGRIETNLKTGTDRVLFDRLPKDDKDMLIKKMTQQEKDYYTSKAPEKPKSRGPARVSRSVKR